MSIRHDWGEPDTSGHDTACDCKGCLLNEWDADCTRLEAERDRYREALEMLTTAIGDVRVSGLAARTYALHEARTAAREALEAGKR